MALIPWSQTDFSGGMTDAILNARPSQCELLENFLISAIEKKPKQRAGSEILDGNIVSTVKPSGRINDLINFQNDTALLIRTTGKMWVKPVATWGAITGPAGNQVFGTTLTDASVANFAEDQQSLYGLAHDPSPTPYVFAPPQKMYRDPTGTWKVLNAGLPKFPDGLDPTNRATLLAAAISMANGIKNVMTSHFALVKTTIVPTVATPTVITIAGNNLMDGDTVYFTTTGVAPTGMTNNTYYYARNIGANSFNLSLTYGGALINVTGAGSGVHSLQAHSAAHAYSFVADATDEDTLITLTKDLHAALQAHITDARLPSFNAYHRFGGIQAFGNFYPRPIYSLATLQECVPVLNDIKNCYNAHEEAFSTSAIDRRLHGSRNYRVSNADLKIANYPVFDPVVGLFVIETFAEQMRVEFNNHLADVTTAGGHGGGADTLFTVSKNTGSDDYFAMGFWRLYLAFKGHRTNNTAHTTGTELTTTALTNGDAAYQALSAGIFYLTARDSISDWETIYADLLDLYNKATLHIAEGAVPNNRHLAAGGTFTIADAILACTFQENSYAFTYRNTYSLYGGFVFEDRSTPAYITSGPFISQIEFITGSSYSTTVAATDLFGVGISEIPALSSAENRPYQTVQKEIWRTKLNGNVYYKAGEVGNSYYTGVGIDLYDRTPDDELSGEALYTTGGVVANDPPPKAQGFWMVGNRAFYGGTVEIVRGAEVHYPKRVRQAIADDPDSVPETFFVDLPADFVCGGAAGGKPVVLTKKGVQRLDGGFTETGEGALTCEAISDTVGGASPTCGGTLDDIFYFAGLDGFYMTDGYRVVPISTHLKQTTYPALSSSALKMRDIQCKVDKTARRIYWTVNQGSTGYPDAIFVLDLNHAMELEQGCFTRLVNGTNFGPTAIEFFGGILHRGDYQGFVFKHTAGLTSDPKITRAAGGSLSGDVVSIPWQLRTVALDFGTDQIAKWVSEMSLELRNNGNASIQPRSINDLNSGQITSMNPIRFRGEYAGVISEGRKFNSTASTGGGYRCIRKQVDLTPANVFIVSSDNSSPVTLASVVGTACTLDTSAYDWPANCEDWYISFETDGYAAQYQILDRVSGDTLTLSGSPGFVGSKKWEIRGVPKDETVEVLALNVYYQALTARSRGVSGAITGGNS